jgi:hypothetical protein
MFVYIQISLLLLVPFRCHCSKELQNNTTRNTGINHMNLSNYNVVPAIASINN